MAKWLEGYNPQEIADALEKAKSVDNTGKVSFAGFAYSDYTAVLNSMVSLSQKIPRLEKKGIITEATFLAARKGKITSDKILAEIKSLESQYLSKSEKEYRLISSISIGRTRELKRSSFDGCTIHFSHTLPKKFVEGIETIRRYSQRSDDEKLPTNYTYIKITVSAKSHTEAAEKALTALDLKRGIWNFFLNRRHPIRISSGKRNPVNSLLLGPLHTLHWPNGKLATESWWYEPDYIHQRFPYDSSKELVSLYNFERKIRRLLDRSKYSDDIKSAFIRYTRALDSANWESSFLSLWSVLELLTATGPNDSYKVTIRRASFVFGSDEYVRQVLTHLRDIRNLFVHMGSDAVDMETAIYQLKRFVEAMIEFHLGNKYGFESIHESAKILDLPCNEKDLSEKEKMILYAKKFLHYR